MARTRTLTVVAAALLIVAPLTIATAGATDGEEGSSAPLGMDDISEALAPVFAILPDADGDGFPDIPTGADGTADFSALDSLIGEPGERDLAPGQNVTVELADGSTATVATPAAAAAALQQVAAAGGDRSSTSGAGSSLTGPCLGIAWSYGADGEPLDMAFDFDPAAPPVSVGEGALSQAFTADNPFKVHVDGAVVYTGLAGGMAPGSGPIDHDWFIRMEFLGFTGTNIDAGGDPNSNGENRNAGSVNLRDDLPGPAKISGLVAVNGQMTADGGFFCSGSGFVEFEGGLDPTLPGVALAFLASVGLLFNTRPALTWGGA